MSAKAPKLSIKDGTSDIAKVTKLNRLKHSLFIITVNTNKCYPDIKSTGLAEAKKELARVVLSRLSGDALYDYIKYLEGSKADLVNIETDAVFERSNKGALHMHFLLHVTHRCKIQFAIEKFREEVNEDLGFVCYMNVKSHSAGISNLRDYISKGIKGGAKLDSKAFEPVTGAGHTEGFGPSLISKVLNRPAAIDTVIENALKKDEIAKKVSSPFNKSSALEDNLRVLMSEKGLDSMTTYRAAKAYFVTKVELLARIESATTGQVLDLKEVQPAAKTMFKKWWDTYQKIYQ